MKKLQLIPHLGNMHGDLSLHTVTVSLLVSYGINTNQILLQQYLMMEKLGVQVRLQINKTLKKLKLMDVPQEVNVKCG